MATPSHPHLTATYLRTVLGLPASPLARRRAQAAAWQRLLRRLDLPQAPFPSP